MNNRIKKFLPAETEREKDDVIDPHIQERLLELEEERQQAEDELNALIDKGRDAQRRLMLLKEDLREYRKLEGDLGNYCSQSSFCLKDLQNIRGEMAFLRGEQQF